MNTLPLSSLSSSSLSIIEVALNKLLHKLWHLPQNSHSAVVHCVAQIDTVSLLVLSRFHSLLSSSLSSPSSLVKSVFLCLFPGCIFIYWIYNNIYGSMHISEFSSLNFIIANNYNSKYQTVPSVIAIYFFFLFYIHLFD